MTYRPIILRTSGLFSGLHRFDIGERDYRPPAMPLVVDFGGRALFPQAFKPRPDKIMTSVVIGPRLAVFEAEATFRWLGTNTRP